MSRWSSSSTSSVETIGGEVEQAHHRHHLQDGKEIVENRVKSPNDNNNTRDNRKYSGGSHEKSEKTRKLNGKEKRSKDSDDKYSNHKHRDSHDKSYDKRKYSDKERKHHELSRKDSKTYETEIESSSRKPHDHHHHHRSHRHSLESDIKNKNYSDENDTLDKGVQIHTKGHRHHRRHHTRHYIDKGRLLPPAPVPVVEVEKRLIHVKDDTTSVSRVIKRESLVSQNQNQNQNQNLPPSRPPIVDTEPPPEEKVKIIHVKDDTTSVSRVLQHKSSVVTPECPVCPVKSKSNQQILLSSESEPETESARKIHPIYSESEPDVDFFSTSNSPDTDTSQKRETFTQSQSNRRSFIPPNSDARNFTLSDSDPRNSIQSDSERRNFIQSNLDRRNFVQADSDPRNFIQSDSERRNFIQSNSDPRNFTLSDPDRRSFNTEESGRRDFILSDLERRNFIQPDSERRIFNTGESDASNFLPPESQRSIFLGDDLESRRNLSNSNILEMPSSIHPPPFSEEDVVVPAPVHGEPSVVSETQEENFHQAKVGGLQEGDTCLFCGRGKILNKFTWTGIIAAILLFPCGIYCCFKCRAQKCSYCGASPT